jgi:hypothetical protein
MSERWAIDQEDADELAAIHAEMVVQGDDAIAQACRKYLQSGERKYRRAMERPKPRLVWDADT